MLNMYDEEINKYQLDNGLTLLCVYKANFVKSHALFVTPFGAQNIIMDDESGKSYDFKLGLAHFLEHKMFESEKGDVSNEFSKMGISANAFTSYSETAYYFSTSFDIEEPLKLLLDFVQELHISEESVTKEKGIICQELKMYQDMPESRFILEMFKSLYHNNPLKYDIGGVEESVNATSLKDLKSCFELNYHPSNMLLVVVSGEDSDKIYNIVNKNQGSKKFTDIKPLRKHFFEEPKSVARPLYNFKMDVNVDRHGMGYKLKPISDAKERYLVDTCLKIALEAYLSSSSQYVQEWLDSRIINDSFAYDSEINFDYAYIVLYSETDKAEAFYKEIHKLLQKMKQTPFSEALLMPIKRRLIGSQIRLMNSFEDYAIVYARMLFMEMDYFESIEILKHISVNDINKVLAYVNLEDFCKISLTS